MRLPSRQDRPRNSGNDLESSLGNRLTTIRRAKRIRGVLSVALCAACVICGGCRDRKVQTIRRGLEDAEKHARDIEQAADDSVGAKRTRPGKNRQP